jgi:hypothetical protein
VSEETCIAVGGARRETARSLPPQLADLVKLIVCTVLASTLLVCWCAPDAVGASASETRDLSTLATTSVPSPVSALDGVVAWAHASGRGHRFEVVIRRRGRNHPLSATSAVGWIDGLQLGSAADGRAIVVYSHCPHKPYGSSRPGEGPTDGCRLWWAPTAGGAAHLIRAAPPDSRVGAALGGQVTFAVQASTASLGAGSVRVETAGLSSASARALPVPHLRGASIEHISVAGTQVAFIENSEQPGAAPIGLSQIWLDEDGAAPRLIASVASDDQPIDESAEFFDGLTLSAGYAYTSLYAQPGLDQPGIQPQVSSRLERISLADLSVLEAPWEPDEYDLGVSATAYDPASQSLIVSSFSRQIDFAAGVERPNSCPVEREAPVAF